MDNAIEETLKKIDELLMRQEDEKEQMLKEIRSNLLKINTSSDQDDENEKVFHEKNQQEDVEAMKVNEDIIYGSEPEPEVNEPLLVAVVGAKNRTGTTHCAISIANYFMRQKKRVAVMEFNDSGEFAAMGRYFDKASEEEFIYNDVKYFARCTLQLLDQIAAHGKYDFIILDLGSYSAEKTLFSRSDLKFIVSGGKPWELESLFLIFQEINKNILLQTNFIFNFVLEDGKEAIMTGMAELGQVYFSSFIENPFEEIDGKIEEVLKEYIEEEKVIEEPVNEKARKVSSIFRRDRNEKSEERRKRKSNFVQTVSAAE